MTETITIRLKRFTSESPEPNQQKREAMARRFMRKRGGQLTISRFV